jgi:hypothetical protein
MEPPEQRSSTGRDTRNVKGFERVVILVGLEEVPQEEKMEERWTEEYFRQQFPDATRGFIVNKNMHKLPPNMKGAIVWLPCLGMVAVVLHACGAKGLVKKLYPRNGNEGMDVEIDMRMQNGCYLEQFYGDELIFKYSQAFRRKQIDRHSNSVCALLDKYDQLKMNTAGPDITIIPNALLPADLTLNKEYWHYDPWTSIDLDHGGKITENRSNKGRLCVVRQKHAVRHERVPVCYVFKKDGCYKKVEPNIANVPFGPAITAGNGTNK